MLRSLFGDLYPLRDSNPVERIAPPDDFAATAILDSDGDARGYAGRAVARHLDRHQRDLFVSGPPAQAMRAHFASLRDEQAAGHRFITLHDPAQMWAGGVVKALADASGQPIERLHLRDQTTLGTLAMIERTTLHRRDDDTLKVYYADVRASGPDAAAVPYALMERSDLTVVIVGPMHSSAINEMVDRLRHACTSNTWRCPQLLFLLPVGATWTADRIKLAEWPASVHVQALTEPLTSTSIVWNILLAHWNRIRPIYPAGSTAQAQSMAASAKHWSASASAPATGWVGTETSSFATRGLAVDTEPPPVESIGPGAVETRAAAPNVARALAVLQELILLDGLIFAALVNANDGRVVASEGRGPDIDRAAAASADILRTHRRTLRHMGHWRPNDPVDEILVTAGSRYHIVRTLQAHPDHFILAVLDKLRSNLAITRFRIMEAQQVLN